MCVSGFRPSVPFARRPLCWGLKKQKQQKQQCPYLDGYGRGRRRGERKRERRRRHTKLCKMPSHQTGTVRLSGVLWNKKERWGQRKFSGIHHLKGWGFAFQEEDSLWCPRAVAQPPLVVLSREMPIPSREDDERKSFLRLSLSSLSPESWSGGQDDTQRGFNISKLNDCNGLRTFAGTDTDSTFCYAVRQMQLLLLHFLSPKISLLVLVGG